jgi:hypothetical protein
MRSHLRRYAPADSKVIAIGNGQLSLGTVDRNSLAWDWGSDGLLKEYAANTPVVGYDPATGILRGTQAWPQVTNSLLDNRDLSTGNWLESDIVVAKDAVGVDGVANSAHTLTDNEGGFFSSIRQTITVSDDSATHSAKYLIKKDTDETRFPELVLQVVGGTIKNQATQINTKTGAKNDRQADGESTVKDAGSWWEVTLSITNNGAGNTSLIGRYYPSRGNTLGGNNADATGSIIVDFGQVYLNTSHEAAKGAPFIETGATAVTREGDDIDLTSIPFYNPAESTIVFKGTFELAGVNRSLLTFKNAAADGTEHIDIRILSNETVSARVVAGNVSQAQLTTSALSAGKFAVALGVKANDFGLSVNGAAVLTDTSGTMPSDLVSLVIGRSRVNTDYARLWIEDITYYPVRLSDAQLQALST